MYGTPEIWSTSVRCIPAAPVTQEELQAYCDGPLLDAATTWLSSADAGFSEAVSLGYVKANRIGANGKYIDPITAEHIVPAPTVLGSGTPMPFQISCVVSLRAPGRGAGTHGRMYIPNQNKGVDNHGQYQVAGLGTTLSTTVDFLNALSTAGDVNLHPAIVSAKGPYNLVSSVEVGSVPDTQRRRRNALVETYQKAVFPPV